MNFGLSKTNDEILDGHFMGLGWQGQPLQNKLPHNYIGKSSYWIWKRPA